MAEGTNVGFDAGVGLGNLNFSAGAGLGAGEKPRRFGAGDGGARRVVSEDAGDWRRETGDTRRLVHGQEQQEDLFSYIPHIKG